MGKYPSFFVSVAVFSNLCCSIEQIGLPTIPNFSCLRDQRPSTVPGGEQSLNFFVCLFLVIALLTGNSQTIKFTPLKCIIQW